MPTNEDQPCQQMAFGTTINTTLLEDKDTASKDNQFTISFNIDNKAVQNPEAFQTVKSRKFKDLVIETKELSAN